MSAGSRILIVDDERPIRRFLRTSLAAHGFEIFEAATGEEALLTAANARPDLVILDLGLPDMDGIEVTRRLREWTQIPIIILSVREQENDKISALDAGADDYLTKPFGVGELTARIRVAMRHAAPAENEPIFQIDDLVVDQVRRRVMVKGVEVSLTPTEYDLLKLLIKHAGKVITHHQILHQVWGQAYADQSHLVRVNISNLRHKIEADPTQPRFVITEPGVGYRLRVED
jgi:two-component system, OmpR family, KDP operon response regulator KdpE